MESSGKGAAHVGGGAGVMLRSSSPASGMSGLRTTGSSKTQRTLAFRPRLKGVLQCHRIPRFGARTSASRAKTTRIPGVPLLPPSFPSSSPAMEGAPSPGPSRKQAPDNPHSYEARHDPERLDGPGPGATVAGKVTDEGRQWINGSRRGRQFHSTISRQSKSTESHRPGRSKKGAEAPVITPAPARRRTPWIHHQRRCDPACAPPPAPAHPSAAGSAPCRLNLARDSHSDGCARRSPRPH